MDYFLGFSQSHGLFPQCIGNIGDAVDKTAMVRKRWEELYDADGAKWLQTAIMNQIFKDNHSLEEFETSGEMLDDFNPLVF